MILWQKLFEIRDTASYTAIVQYQWLSLYRRQILPRAQR